MVTNISKNNSDTKRNRFIKIAERRVNQVLNNLDSLGKCSNKRNYQYTEEEVNKIFREIEKKVKEIKVRFQGEDTNKSRFKL